MSGLRWLLDSALPSFPNSVRERTSAKLPFRFCLRAAGSETEFRGRHS
jgi:hypothetical protein